MALTVTITGGMNIDQGDEVTLNATVMDADGNTPVGTLQYAWSTSHGSFIGTTNEATATYHADFTDSNDVDVVITCDVTRPADAAPTVDSASLTAMTELGITGQELNMYISPTDDTVAGISNIYDQNSGASSLVTGSNDILDLNKHIWRVRWNTSINVLILNNDGAGGLYSYFLTNTDKSVFIIFDNGVVEELTPVGFGNDGFARWSVTDSIIIQKLTDLDDTSMLLVGVGDTDSIGLDEDTGSVTETITAAAPSLPMVTVPDAPTSLSLTKTHNSIVATWGAATNNGGEAPIRYDVRINTGNWIDAGLDLTHTFSNLSPETEYTLDVVQVNSAGRGAVATASVTTDAAPVAITVPGAPRSLSLTETHNSIVAVWAAAVNDGGESPTHYDIRIDGGGWIDAGLDLTHTFQNLSPNTAYTIEVAQVNSAGQGDSASASVTTDAAPVVITAPSAPTSLSLTETHNSIVAVWAAAVNDGGESPTHYDIRIDGGQWIDAGLDLTHTFENLSPTTQYTVDVAQVNSAGRGNPATESVTTDAAPVAITVPGAPRSLSLTETHNSIVATWRAAANNGGESPTHYDVRIDGGAWIDTGLDLRHTFENLSPSTQYLIEVAEVNSAGRGTPASKSVRTDAAPIVITTPSAPRSLSLTKTHNSIVARWAAAANNGGEAPSRYDVRINRGQWIDTGLDLTHTFENLSAETQYLIEVAEVNSAGRGTPASKSVRTDAAPVVITAPAAPQNLTVELTATTAILKWAISGTGSPADTYEVSYAEGDRVGSDWIDTKSLRTRFFIRRLKRATRYTFGVRGRNSEGAGDASRPVTQNTPIASLHNALFFKECVNYLDNGGRVSEHGNASNIIREVADNDYQTFTREKDLVINIAVGGNPTRIDAIFVKGQDIERHSAAPTGGSGSGYRNRRMPLVVKNWEGTEVSTVVAGFQHDLYLLDQHFTATSVRLTFTGANARIVEIMLLEFGIEIDANSDFTEIATNFVDRTGVVHPDPAGGISYTPPLGGGRDRWQIDYAVKVVPGKTLLQTPEEFLYWRSENRNHVHAQEPSLKPWRVFPAVFLGKSVPVRYRTDDKTGGEILNFRVAEQ